MLAVKDLKYKPDKNFLYDVFLLSSTCQTCIVIKSKLSAFEYFLFEYDRKLRAHFQTNLSPPLNMGGLSVTLPLNDDEMRYLEKFFKNVPWNTIPFNFEDGTPDYPTEFNSSLILIHFLKVVKLFIFFCFKFWTKKKTQFNNRKINICIYFWFEFRIVCVIHYT